LVGCLFVGWLVVCWFGEDDFGQLLLPALCGWRCVCPLDRGVGCPQYAPLPLLRSLILSSSQFCGNSFKFKYLLIYHFEFIHHHLEMEIKIKSENGSVKHIIHLNTLSL
jgi:hypothetical protein